jgi:hypothetical protein
METRQWNQKDGVRLSLLLIYEHLVDMLHGFVDRPDYQWKQQNDVSARFQLPTYLTDMEVNTLR